MGKSKGIDFKYVPLSFIATQNEIERQSLNTVIFQQVLNDYGVLRTLGELLEKTQYGYTASAKENGECHFLRITDINNGKVNWNSVPYCDCERKEKYNLSPKDILIARTGNNISYLVQDDVPDNTVFASYLIRLICNQEYLLPEYLYLFLNSYAFWPQILKKQRGALLQNVNAKRMSELLIPYCPLNIQKELIKKHSSTITIKQGKIKELLGVNNQLFVELTHQQTLLKKLRQQILQEAIEGKLTADWRKQNPDVDPASELLKRIQAEKAQLIKDKKIKKQKPLPPISEEEKPFELPDGWVWCRLGDLSKQYVDCPHDTPKYQGKGFLCLRAPDITENGLLIKTIRRVSKEEYDKRIRRLKPVRNDLVYIREGGRLGIAGLIDTDEPVCLGQRVMMLRFLNEVTAKYSLRFLNAPDTYNDIVGKTIGSASPHVNVRDIIAHVVPVPPLPEQKAIVTKVEKLLALCDQLESQITRNQRHAEQLMQAVLREAFSQPSEQAEKEASCV